VELSLSVWNFVVVQDKMSALQIDPDAQGEGEDDEELSQAVVNRLVALKQIHVSTCTYTHIHTPLLQYTRIHIYTYSILCECGCLCC
jgi:hypothetical protein